MKPKNSIVPFGNRVLLQVPIIIVKNGTEEREEPSQEGKVMASNVEGVKKGQTVFFNPYGAVSVNSLKTKKAIVLIVDAEDVYATL